MFISQWTMIEPFISGSILCIIQIIVIKTNKMLSKLVVVMLLLLVDSYYSFSMLKQNRNNYHQHYQSATKNEIPQTYQHQLKSTLLSTSQKMLGSVAYLQLLQPKNKAYAADIELSAECSDSLVILKGPNLKDIILIGTAHISEESANLVRRTVRTIKPDLVMIELDLKRIGKFDDDRATGFLLPSDGTLNNNNDNMRVSSLSSSSLSSTSSSTPLIVKNQQKQFTAMLSGWANKIGGIILGKALGQFYGSIEKLGFTTGGEFKAAIEEANEVGAKILLGDRDVEITLQRLAKAIATTDADSFTRLGNRLENLQESIGLSDLDTIIENKQQALSAIEQMKQTDTLNTMLSVVKDEVPLVYSALIGERDEYMAKAIENAKGKVLVGVVGMAHMSGIEKFLMQKGFYVVKRNCPTNPKPI